MRPWNLSRKTWLRGRSSIDGPRMVDHVLRALSASPLLTSSFLYRQLDARNRSCSGRHVVCGVGGCAYVLGLVRFPCTTLASLQKVHHKMGISL